MNFSLADTDNVKGKELTGYVLGNPGGAALLIQFDGYGERNAEPYCAFPVLIENRGGVPHVVIWGDITQEDPTHVISLAGADLNLDKDKFEES